MLQFKTSCAVLAYRLSNLLNEVDLSLFRYFEVGLYVYVYLYVCAISSSKSSRPLSHLLMSSCYIYITTYQSTESSPAYQPSSGLKAQTLSSPWMDGIWILSRFPWLKIQIAHGLIGVISFMVKPIMWVYEPKLRY